MRDYWLRFGCFLIGYNYPILKSSSEVSYQKVIRLTSALLIICLLWAFVGFSFSDRYLRTSLGTSIIALLIMVFLAIQIERQVILASKENKMPLLFRTGIAILMAIIGSTIIDQIIFKDDIEKQKLFMMDESINKILPGKTMELRAQVNAIESTIQAKEHERTALVNEISKSPKITIYKTEKITAGRHQDDSARTETVTRTAEQIPNPKMDFLKPLDDQIKSLREEKFKKDSSLLVLRPAIEAELKSNTGFLDELGVMLEIFKSSRIALMVWLIWFALLLGVELFIAVSKWNDSDCDYEKMIQLQMELHIRRIELLKTQTNG
jgi:hypothetical protein